MRALLLLAVCATLAGAQTAVSPQQLFQNAISAQQRGDDPVAIANYRELLKAYPNSLEVHANLGAVLAHAGQYPAAVDEYKLALKLAPTNTAVQLNLALAFYKKGDWKEAAAELERLHAAQPQDTRTSLLLADTKLHLGQANDALAILKPLEESQSGNLDIERLLANALLQAGHRKEALRQLHALAEATKDPGVCTLAAKTAMELNEFEVVKKDADAALALDPNTPGAWTLKGQAMTYLLDNAGALAALQRAVQQNARDFDAQLSLGALLSTMRDLPNAAIHLKQALQLNPSSAVAHYEFGKVENSSGQADAALADFQKATATDPNWMPPHVSLAALYAKLHRPDDARRERELVDKLRIEEQKKEVQTATEKAP